MSEFTLENIQKITVNHKAVQLKIYIDNLEKTIHQNATLGLNYCSVYADSLFDDTVADHFTKLGFTVVVPKKELWEARDGSVSQWEYAPGRISW